VQEADAAIHSVLFEQLSLALPPALGFDRVLVEGRCRLCLRRRARRPGLRIRETLRE
jgi:hypothetical protein